MKPKVARNKDKWKQLACEQSAKFGHGYNIRRAGPNGDFMRRRKTSFSKNIYRGIC